MKGNWEASKVAMRWMQEKFASSSMQASFASPEPLQRRRADEAGGKIFVMGGYNDNSGSLSSVEMYDTAGGDETFIQGAVNCRCLLT